MRRNAMLAGAEDRVHAVDAADGGAAATGLALIARRARIVKIEAARPLQQVATGRRHIAQLLRGTSEYRAPNQRIARLDLRVPGEIAVRNQRTDAQAAVLDLLDFVEW